MIERLLKRVNRLLVSKFYWTKTVSDFDPSYFDGKSIAIIGGADTAMLEKKGAYIDSFDIVIRVNRGIDNYQQYSDYLGTKTDVLFHGLHEDPINGCGPVKPIEWFKKGVKKVVFPLVGEVEHKELLKTYVHRSKGKLPIMQVSEKEFLEITASLNGYRTTTGFAALYFMSKVNYKKLYITGFTFFRTAHQKGYNDKVNLKQVLKNIKDRNFHNPELEFAYFQNFYLRTENVEIDAGMKLIM